MRHKVRRGAYGHFSGRGRSFRSSLAPEALYFLLIGPLQALGGRKESETLSPYAFFGEKA